LRGRLGRGSRTRGGPMRPSDAPRAWRERARAWRNGTSRGGFVPTFARFVPSAPDSSLPKPDSSHFGFCGLTVFSYLIEISGEVLVCPVSHPYIHTEHRS
jgi:hypothetical protein